MNKRNFIGAILFIILSGEPTVGFVSGLFSPGFIIFFFLYFFLFALLDRLILDYELNVVQVILLTFIIYSVFITGFLHKEIAEFILTPKNDLITVLMRIQPSFYTVYSFYLLNRWIPRKKEDTIPLKSSILGILGVVILLSLTKLWGIPYLVYTFLISPLLSLLFITLSLIALFLIFKLTNSSTEFYSKKFLFFSFLFLVIGVIPILYSFLVLLVLMSIVTIVYLFNPNFRSYKL